MFETLLCYSFANKKRDNFEERRYKFEGKNEKNPNEKLKLAWKTGVTSDKNVSSILQVSMASKRRTNNLSASTLILTKNRPITLLVNLLSWYKDPYGLSVHMPRLEKRYTYHLRCCETFVDVFPFKFPFIVRIIVNPIWSRSRLSCKDNNYMTYNWPNSIFFNFQEYANLETAEIQV